MTNSMVTFVFSTIGPMIRYISITKHCKFMFFVGCICWLSCNGAPNHVNEDKMVKVLADAMTMEAGHQIRYNYGLLPDSIWQRDYGFICKKHQVDYQDFVKELTWYQEEPEAYSLLMEKVITRLQQADARFGGGVKPKIYSAMEAKVRALMDTTVSKGIDTSLGRVLLKKKDNNRRR